MGDMKENRRENSATTKGNKQTAERGRKEKTISCFVQASSSTGLLKLFVFFLFFVFLSFFFVLLFFLFFFRLHRLFLLGVPGLPFLVLVLLFSPRCLLSCFSSFFFIIFSFFFSVFFFFFFVFGYCHLLSSLNARLLSHCVRPSSPSVFCLPAMATLKTLRDFGRAVMRTTSAEAKADLTLQAHTRFMASFDLVRNPNL